MNEGLLQWPRFSVECDVHVLPCRCVLAGLDRSRLMQPSSVPRQYEPNRALAEEFRRTLYSSSNGVVDTEALWGLITRLKAKPQYHAAAEEAWLLPWLATVQCMPRFAFDRVVSAITQASISAAMGGGEGGTSDATGAGAGVDGGGGGGGAGGGCGCRNGARTGVDGGGAAAAGTGVDGGGGGDVRGLSSGGGSARSGGAIGLGSPRRSDTVALPSAMDCASPVRRVGRGAKRRNSEDADDGADGVVGCDTPDKRQRGSRVYRGDGSTAVRREGRAAPQSPAVSPSAISATVGITVVSL